MICAQARVPGVSVSQVARRYDVNANQVFNWLKDSRFKPDAIAEDVPCFLPVEIVEETQSRIAAPDTAGGQIDIELAGGHRLKISGSYDPEALARLIGSLAR